MVEADFQREYGIDLTLPESLKRVTWRRFLVLVRGLSPQSATIAHLQADSYIGKKREDVVEVTGTPEQVDRAFEALFAPPPGKQH